MSKPARPATLVAQGSAGIPSFDALSSMHFLRVCFVLLLFALAPAIIRADILTPVASRDNKIIKRWELPGDPRGLAIGKDGTIYIGLAQPQAVAAIDPATGEVKKRVVLDSADIAATKELVTLRTSADGTRLVVANGSDESATLLSLPDLTVLREITLEGEQVRDAMFDPAGKLLYVLGRRLHVYDAAGEKELHKLDFADPMAMAISSNGRMLALLGSHDFGNGRVTVAALYETTNFKQLDLAPMQTDNPVGAALFVDQDRAIVAIAADHFYEKPILVGEKKLDQSSGKMRMTIDFGDLVNSEKICLPEGTGPQIAAAGPPPLVFFAERRCSSSVVFSGSGWKSSPASLYGVAAYAIAFDPKASALWVTDRAGFLTAYKVPKTIVAK
jgi:DNA-binding beta-propeller fold protein YncE